MSNSQPAREHLRTGDWERKAATPDIILIHPALAPRAVQRILPEQWPDGNTGMTPPGYREISSAFFGPRAFCREGSAASLPEMDPDLPQRVRKWVDVQTQRWDFEEIFTARELNFWAFLRDRMIGWFHRLMVERRTLEHLAGTGGCIVLTAGLDPFRRLLLKALGEVLPGGFRPEVAYLEAPAQRARETRVERRVRKAFFLLQDAWHGVQFLGEDLLGPQAQGAIRLRFTVLDGAQGCERRMGPH